MVVAAMVMMAAVASPLDEPQHLLCATEEPPDLAYVHVRLAFFSVILREQSYEAPREKFRPEPLVFRGVGEQVRIKVAVHMDGFAGHVDSRCLKGLYRGESPERRLTSREGEA